MGGKYTTPELRRELPLERYGSYPHVFYVSTMAVALNGLGRENMLILNHILNSILNKKNGNFFLWEKNVYFLIFTQRPNKIS